MKALEKAVARKKELAQMRKEERDKIRHDIEQKIHLQPSNIKEKETQVEEAISEPPKEKKKKTRIVERVVEEPESSSSEEEIIERVIVKKVPRQKPKKAEDDIHDIIEKTNKEMLMERLKEAQKKKAMAELFSW